LPITAGVLPSLNLSLTTLSLNKPPKRATMSLTFIYTWY